MNYHEIAADKNCLEQEKEKHLISQVDFIKQLDLINEQNIPIVSLSDWINGKVTHSFSIVLTFDNCHQSDYNIVLPILRKRKLKATFFPVLSYIDKPNKLSWKELVEIGKDFEIGSQGVLNKNMRLIGKEGCKFELELSKRILEQRLNVKIESFAAPFGQYNRRILQMAFNSGYKNLFSSKLKINASNNDFILHRWNIKKNTSLAVLKNTLANGHKKGNEKKSVSTFKRFFSKGVGIGFFQKANVFMYKLTEKQ